MSELLPVERVESKIFFIRGQKVMLDKDLAELYGSETKYLKRQVKRNYKRFPDDFMFQLTRKEYNSLRCQIGTLEKGKHTKYLPYAFTEQGVAMLSSVLNSERAIQVNIAIMRAFVKLRRLLSANKKFSSKLLALERKIESHDGQIEKHDMGIQAIFDAIRKLMLLPEKPTKKIGFLSDRS